MTLKRDTRTEDKRASIEVGRSRSFGRAAIGLIYDIQLREDPGARCNGAEDVVG